MIAKVISGGQTGADQAGLKAAKELGIPTGGWAPKHYYTEKGFEEWLKNEYGLKEHSSPLYRERTIANVKECDALFWFGSSYTPGGKLTIGQCIAREPPVPFCVVISGREFTPKQAADWLYTELIEGEEELEKVLMIAGNRESTNLGIGKLTYRFLIETFGERELTERR